MENRRYVMVPLLALLILALATPAVLAYDNAGMHRTVNAAAIVDFENSLMTLDPSLYNAKLNLYAQVYGYAWDIPDGKDTSKTFTYTQNISVYRSKWMGKWVVDGGFSGDEPEAPMAVRHFFDPKNTSFPYLTSQIPWSVNPRMDAITWALSSKQNRYSFINGKSYFASAMASEKPDKDGNYGNAWRAVGETMHVMADLCNPAHVRNDGHVYSDPLEEVTGSPVVLKYRDNTPAPLDYSCTFGKHSLRDVMAGVATWTNENFFSSDTTPGNGNQYFYALPVATRGPDSDGYYYAMYKGQEMKAYRYTLKSLYIANVPVYDVRDDAAVAQQERLVPTAIRASEAVLDAFLPRFAVFVDSVPASASASSPGYVVNAHIEHIPTVEWPKNSFPEGSIRNGAYIRVYHASGTSNNYFVPLYANNPTTSLNRISTVVPAEPGDTIVAYYDFGGYQVYSNAYTITGTAPTAKPTVSPQYPPEYDGAYHEVDVPVFTYSGGTVENLGLLIPDDPLRPGQSFLLTVFQSCSGGNLPRMLPEDDRGRLFELYVHRNATLTINTGGLTMKDYSQDVQAYGDYVAAELPFRVRDNASPGAYSVTVTVADEFGKTRSARFEIMVA